MDVIPVPRSTMAMTDVSCTITGSSSVVTRERVLQPIADWLATEAERLASIPLSATGGSDSRSILRSRDDPHHGDGPPP